MPITKNVGLWDFSCMLRDIVPVPRAAITLAMFPDRVKWVQCLNESAIAPNRTFVARLKQDGKPVVGTALTDEILIYTIIDNIPHFNAADISSATAESAKEWRVTVPELSDTRANIDMKVTIDLDFLDSKYVESVFGGSVAIFVKSALARARTSGLGSSKFPEKLRLLIKTPEELSRSYEDQQFDDRMRPAFEAWKSTFPERPPREAINELRHRETQLQIVLCLELLRTESIESVDSLLTQHFDSLLLWQMVDPSTDLAGFCKDTLWPFFKATNREKLLELMKLVQGPAPQKRTKPKPGIAAVRSSSAVSLLSQARKLSQKPSAPARTTSQLKPLGRKVSRSLSRQVDISFKVSKKTSRTSSPATQAPPMPPAPKRSQPKIVHRAKSVPAVVQATPVSKRHILLPKEDIPFEMDETIGSTDED